MPTFGGRRTNWASLLLPGLRFIGVSLLSLLGGTSRNVALIVSKLCDFTIQWILTLLAAFLLDNGAMYHIANGTALGEYLLTLYFKPSLKSYAYVSAVGKCFSFPIPLKYIYYLSNRDSNGCAGASTTVDSNDTRVHEFLPFSCFQ